MSNFDKLIHDAKMKASFQKTDQNPSKKPRIVEKAGGSQMETETDGEEKGPLRSRVLAYIGKCHTSVHRLMMDGVDPNMEEVDLGKQIFNVVFNAYNAMRQSANGGSAKKKAIFDESGAKVMFENQSYQQPASAIYPIMTLCAKDFKLEYRKFEKDDQENWYSMASPYMTCLTLFGQRIREQRIGLSQVIIGKADEKPLVTPSQRFGIDPHLQILAEGLNIPPEKKSAIASALGPLTVLFELYKSKGEFQIKWKNACKQQLSFIPGIKEIVDLVPNLSVDDVAKLIRAVGNLLLFTTCRQKTKVSFPPNVFAKIVTLESVRIQGPDGKEANVAQAAILETFNFSGKGAFFAYRIQQTMTLRLGGTGLDSNKAAQIVFHAQFGTYNEDLSVLAAITPLQNWLLRSELENAYKGHSTVKSVVLDKIPFNYWSKMTSANQSGEFTDSGVQLAVVPKFSGKRTQHFNKDLFKVIGEREGLIMYGDTIDSYINNIRAMCVQVKNKCMQANMTLKWGTTEWFTIRDAFPNYDPVPIDLVVDAKGVYFMGRKRQVD